MSRVYTFNDPQDMIELAMTIETKVYWGNSFYIDDEEYKYTIFWSLCKDALDSGCTGVEIIDNEVVFIR